MGRTARKIGAALKRLREQQGLSQEALAKRAGLTQPYVAMIEGRRRASPSLDVLERLAKALKVRLAELLE